MRDILTNDGHGAHRPVAPDELFRALDHAELRAADSRWNLEVFSILDDTRAGVRWVQVGIDGPVKQMATLRLEAEDGVPEVVSALSSWLDGADDPAEHLVSSL